MYKDTYEFLKDYRIDEFDRLHGYIRHCEKLTKGYYHIVLPTATVQDPHNIYCGRQSIGILVARNRCRHQ